MKYGIKVSGLNTLASALRGLGDTVISMAAKQMLFRQQNKPADTQFCVGQLVEHKELGYRGVIFDLDPEFMLSDEWYEQQAISHAPQDQPWYHVLVHNGVQSCYVPQCKLREASCIEQINHPALGEYFRAFDGHQYASFNR